MSTMTTKKIKKRLVVRPKSFKLYDFNFKDIEPQVEEDECETTKYVDTKQFTVQMFGINELGQDCSITIPNFTPFFYVEVGSKWGKSLKAVFIANLKQRVSSYYTDSILVDQCKIISRKKLYGFNSEKEFKFLLLKFKNSRALNVYKNLWYNVTDDTNRPGYKKYKLLQNGYKFQGYNTYIYEANIPSILRLFHIQDISPSGWIEIDNKYKINDKYKYTTCCKYEYICNYQDITPLNNKETVVPYKIMSFDIEVDSSHGDFPLATKSYKKLATNIIDHLENLKSPITTQQDMILKIHNLVYISFGYGEERYDIDLVYTKQENPSKEELYALLCVITQMIIKDVSLDVDTHTKEQAGEKIRTLKELETVQTEEEDNIEIFISAKTKVSERTETIVDLLLNQDKRIKRETKIVELNKVFTSILPKLEGDKVTFIGSTFINLGDKTPYLNHIIVLGDCSELPDVPNQEVVCIDTTKTGTMTTKEAENYAEKQLLTSWTDMVQRENPDIVIGYNIWGFDWSYMFSRAVETGCEDDFIKLSKNIDEDSGQRNWQTNKLGLYTSSIRIASGDHDFNYPIMNGRFQIDLYSVFRREHNLTSYKLDYVAGHFIGDVISECIQNETSTIIKSSNLNGLYVGSYIHIEEIGYSSDYYDNGAKFMVIHMESDQFTIDNCVYPSENKVIRWGLAKDDVSPQEIFSFARQGADGRATVAKYCIQDCNIVQELLSKLDIITGCVEMSKLCTVPMSFLITRGQGIKLTSFISKKCREKQYLMPCLDKDESDAGYEGAIVLDPKCGLYFEDPVGVLDYGSLYPSSMIGDNICHSSKVCTKEYDLEGNLINEMGEKDPITGIYIYDNLPDYIYKDKTFDTFIYKRKTPKAKADKICVGYKTCRFAEHASGTKAVIPSVLQELLMSRKDTKKLMATETDPFMKNVYDKRQLSIKLTANSLYGQCGAKTSQFYEPDVAASCTATGRNLLIYAKLVIEKVYGDRVCETKNHGNVRTKAKYIYGDTDSVFICFFLEELDGTLIKNKKALEITIELAQQAGQLATKFLTPPHDLEYEKTFLPFCLLSKKRYVGMLYEYNINNGKRKEMGIVLKRRDNAKIVKDSYGGVIDILMKDHSVPKALIFISNVLSNLVNGDIHMDKLIISKSLNSNYKKPKSIAHKVLADRISQRDPGNKPKSGDRIPFVYIKHPDKKALQGERIETPQFIMENELEIDYNHYITNQIMKPLLQLFALVLEDIPGFNDIVDGVKRSNTLQSEIDKINNDIMIDDVKKETKIQTIREKMVQTIIFEKYINN
jgi:DNA polymerase elongation subunit (family B)